MKNKWRDIKIDISLRIIFSTIPLIGGLIFILYLKTFPAIIVGIFFVCIFLSIFIINLISYKNYWNINAFVNDFGSITWSKPLLSEDKKYKILLDFFNANKIEFNISNNKKDFTNLKCYKTFHINKINLFIGITKWGYLLYGEKSNDNSINLLKRKFGLFIDTIID